MNSASVLTGSLRRDGRARRSDSPMARPEARSCSGSKSSLRRLLHHRATPRWRRRAVGYPSGVARVTHGGWRWCRPRRHRFSTTTGTPSRLLAPSARMRATTIAQRRRVETKIDEADRPGPERPPALLWLRGDCAERGSDQRPHGACGGCASLLISGDGLGLGGSCSRTLDLFASSRHFAISILTRNEDHC